jgi:hypothetical protein
MKLALFLAVCGVTAALVGVWMHAKHGSAPPAQTAAAGKTAYAGRISGATDIYAHNLRLHQGPDFRVYIRWLRGQLVPARVGATASFDDPESFYLNVSNGVISVNLGDIGNYLNDRSGSAPLRDISLTGNGDQIKITGKLHKVVTLPVELLGGLTPASNGRVQIHVTKINVLKVPFAAVMGGMHVTLSDVVGSTRVAGMEIVGDDIFLEPQTLLPPPHLRGNLTKVAVRSPDMEAVYGDAKEDVEHVEQWRNFLRLKNGTLRFGRLTMQNADLIMVDLSQDSWFDLDLVNYQAQLVHGYTRMTATQGLQIFMPDYADLNKGGSVEWIKNRNVAPPAGVMPSQ